MTKYLTEVHTDASAHTDGHQGFAVWAAILYHTTGGSVRAEIHNDLRNN